MNKELTFKFTLEEANLILGAISKMPLETIEGVVNKFRKQGEEQLKQQAAKVTTDETVVDAEVVTEVQEEAVNP